MIIEMPHLMTKSLILGVMRKVMSRRDLQIQFKSEIKSDTKNLEEYPFVLKKAGSSSRMKFPSSSSIDER